MHLLGRREGDQPMRVGFVIAAIVMTLGATGAQAQEWCGYAIHDNAIVECGYTTVADCQTAVGKGGMCFVDPELALKTKRTPYTAPVKAVSDRG
jgi:hypothetical protein